MLRRLLYISAMLVVLGSSFLPLNAAAQTRVSNASHNSLVSLDFPVPDPLYIYNQFSYVTSHFQRREAGYTANQGHDRFAAYWTQEMVNNLAGFGTQVRRDAFAIHGWRERPAGILSGCWAGGNRRIRPDQRTERAIPPDSGSPRIPPDFGNA